MPGRGFLGTRCTRRVPQGSLDDRIPEGRVGGEGLQGGGIGTEHRCILPRARLPDQGQLRHIGLRNDGQVQHLLTTRLGEGGGGQTTLLVGDCGHSAAPNTLQLFLCSCRPNEAL